jgi:uncharacterized protein YeaO (DUF488 family)
VQVQIKRIYDPPTSSDGLRVLIDRLWPRGVAKEDAAVDVWAKELAPSNELRKWFAHEDEKFEEFTRRYHLELANATGEIDKLLTSVDDGVVTLLYAAKNTTSNHAIVLQAWFLRHA